MTGRGECQGRQSLVKMPKVSLVVVLIVLALLCVAVTAGIALHDMRG